MSSKKLILVTGASGFIGAHAVESLLSAGYAVRGTSRSGKADALRKSYPTSDFEVAIVEDLAKGDFSEALKGIHAVVHIASPMPTTAADYVQIAVDSTVNVLRQAYEAKIYKLVLMSSIFAAAPSWPSLLDPSLRVDHNTWLNVSYDEAVKITDPMAGYSASKALAEKAAWEFAESHSEIDLTALLPMFIYGPLAAGHVVKNPRAELSTDGWLYQIVGGPEAAYPPTVGPQEVDVRDVAKAIVKALDTAPSKERKRVLLWGDSFRWKQAVKHLASARPDLKVRMVDGGVVEDEELGQIAWVDKAKSKEILGITEWIPWQKTVEDAVDSILKREATWM